MNATDAQQELAARVVAAVSALEGVQAIALGGSLARGAGTPDSDIDLGLYYRDSAPFDIEQLRAVGNQLNDTIDPVLVDYGDWGPWVNGGAWLTIDGQRLDFLYRSLDRLQQVIDDCQAGQFETDYTQQPATGFYSYIYLAELSICEPLYDPHHQIGMLKKQLVPYPVALKAAIIRGFSFHATFALENAIKPARREDVYMVVGCLYRAASAMVQILFAQNEHYFISDKGALDTCAGFTIKPPDFRQRVIKVLTQPGANASELTRSVELFQALVGEMVS